MTSIKESPAVYSPFYFHVYFWLESQFFEIALRHGCSPVNLLHIFRTPFLQNASGRPLLQNKRARNINNVFHILIQEMFNFSKIRQHEKQISKNPEKTCEESFCILITTFLQHPCDHLFLSIYPFSSYHYCTTSFNKASTQVLRRLKSCSQRVGDSRW